LASRLVLLPDGVGGEVRTTIERVVARPRGAGSLLEVLETEAGRLCAAVVPVLASRPLPIRRAWLGRTVTGSCSAVAAALGEADEIAIVATDGLLAPTLPTVLAAHLVALVVELWIAVSVRVHQIESSGRCVDTAILTSEVTAALVGSTSNFGIGGGVATAVGQHLVRRWAKESIPGLGILSGAIDSQATIRALSEAPLYDYPFAKLGFIWPERGWSTVTVS
jgi:hypothetical protein